MTSVSLHTDQGQLGQPLKPMVQIISDLETISKKKTSQTILHLACNAEEKKETHRAGILTSGHYFNIISWHTGS